VLFASLTFKSSLLTEFFIVFLANFVLAGICLFSRFLFLLVLLVVLLVVPLKAVVYTVYTGIFLELALLKVFGAGTKYNLFSSASCNAIIKSIIS
jgi:hypothetical protein